MYFDIIGEVTDQEIIATGSSIHELSRLNRVYGNGRWKKMKGCADILIKGGKRKKAEVHWYEAHGIGKREYKIKRFLT